MRKKVGIMQPYFLPYIGYWQLISHVDEFVLYDNIKYTKKGWINRNRLLMNGADALFSLPLKSASDFLPVTERDLSGDFDREKLLRQFREAYKKAPFFQENFPVIEEIITFPQQNLFKYIEHSIKKICSYLDIRTKTTLSSEIPLDHAALRAEDKVLALCKALGATDYINPIGGTQLYEKAFFKNEDIDLAFLKARALDYPQFSHSFVPHLSILDVMMFNNRERTISYLSAFDLH